MDFFIYIPVQKLEDSFSNTYKIVQTFYKHIEIHVIKHIYFQKCNIKQIKYLKR